MVEKVKELEELINEFKKRNRELAVHTNLGSCVEVEASYNDIIKYVKTKM